jgi:hypothetical protein
MLTMVVRVEQKREGGDLVLIPINSWYRFEQARDVQSLSSDAAEKEFQRRAKGSKNRPEGIFFFLEGEGGWGKKLRRGKSCVCVCGGICLCFI